MLAASLLLLAGCRADVVFRFDVHTNGSALATTTETMDEQLYRLVLGQGGDDPLGIARLQREGWTVSRAYDDNGNHVVTISKVLSPGDLSVGGATTALRGATVPFSSIDLSRKPGLFVEQDSLKATIAPILPWAQATLNKPYSAAVWAVASSAVALHFELRTPGDVLATNGETTPRGFVRWDLGLQAPTVIQYRVRVVHYDRIIAIALIALAALAWGVRAYAASRLRHI